MHGVGWLLRGMLLLLLLLVFWRGLRWWCILDRMRTGRGGYTIPRLFCHFHSKLLRLSTWGYTADILHYAQGCGLSGRAGWEGWLKGTLLVLKGGIKSLLFMCTGFSVCFSPEPITHSSFQRRTPLASRGSRELPWMVDYVCQLLLPPSPSLRWL